MCNSRREKPCLALLDTNLCRYTGGYTFFSIHRHNLEYSLNPVSSSCWTRLRCNVHNYSRTCRPTQNAILLSNVLSLVRRTFFVHVSDMLVFIHSTKNKTLQKEFQRLQNLCNSNSAKVCPLRPPSSTALLWYWWS